jgi:hypothetical protein
VVGGAPVLVAGASVPKERLDFFEVELSCRILRGKRCVPAYGRRGSHRSSSPLVRPKGKPLEEGRRMRLVELDGAIVGVSIFRKIYFVEDREQ